MTERDGYDRLKRWLDLLGAAAMLVITAPPLLIAAFLIKRDGGPVLFKHTRMGRNGDTFTLLKLRTMVPKAHEMEDDLKEQQCGDGGYGVCGDYADPRVTKIGRLLRLLNIDELPQLVNVLKGDMSLIGPRPVPFSESLLYGESRDKVLTVRPGLTGYWQVNRKMSTAYEERVEMDCYYVDHRSLALDLRIIALTPVSMLTSDYNSCTKPLPPLADGIVISDRALVTAAADRRTQDSFKE